MTLEPYFATDYASARAKFLAAADACGAQLDAHLHPHADGAQGEPLAVDVARIGGNDARHLLVLSSGVHGLEGRCGSGCQVALLHDTDLLAQFKRAGVALLLIHAVNPYGFSHERRVNEDNIDLNRNFLAHSLAPQDASKSSEYDAVHPLLLPAEWPPSADNCAAIAAYVQLHGERAFQRAVTTGQSSHPDGLFYSGRAPAWSNQILRQVLHGLAGAGQALAWIDLHSGLGVPGHGEKLYAGRDDPAELARARAWWGADVTSPRAGSSASEEVRGSVASAIYTACPAAQTTSIALEFGTVPLPTMIDALRADQWLRSHPDTPAAQRAEIQRQVAAAFYIDTDAWRGALVAQTRVAVLQACHGLTTSH